MHIHLWNSAAKDRRCKAEADPRIPPEVLQKDSQAALKVHRSLGPEVIRLQQIIGCGNLYALAGGFFFVLQ